MIQVYTGNGKGKTTAALGLALRAAGAGMKVYIGQFAKGRKSSELNSLKKINKIKLEQFGRGCFVGKKPSSLDVKLANNGFKRVKEITEAGVFDLIILDEVLGAVGTKMIDIDEVLIFLKRYGGDTEIVLTGRSCPRAIIGLADLVSEIKEVKHYFHKGQRVRKGIEL